MKKQICIYVDMDAWITAKNKTENISQYLNECLINLSGRSKEDDTIENIKTQLEAIRNSKEELSVKESILKMELERKEEEKIERERLEKEREQHKRWECPVCQTPNELNTDTCSKCRVRTRGKNYKEVYIK